MTSPNHPDPSLNRDPNSTGAAAAKAPTKRKKRRKWPWILVGLVVLLLILVLLAPTLISSGPVRGMIASKASNYINGSVQIGDMSLGWFSGTRLGGVKVYDEKGVLILELDQFKTQMSLMNAIRGNYNLGDTLVDANLTKCTVFEDGSTNYQKLAKKSETQPQDAKPDQKPPQPSEPAKPGEPSKLPNVSGNVTVKYRGTIDGPGVPEVIHLDPSTAIVKISDINQPITDDIRLVYRLGNNAPATVSLAGTIDAIENNLVLQDPTKMVADQRLQLANVDLAAAGPFVNPKKGQATTQPTEMGGIANGEIVLKADGKSSASANGAILVTNLLFGGGPLKGDRYTSSKLNLPVNVTASAVDPSTTLLNITQLGVQTDQANISLTGKTTQQALQNLAAQKAPGSDGNLSLVLDVTNVPALAKQLRNTLSLQQGVDITGGKIYSKTDVAIAKDRVTIAQDPNTVIQASGTNNGKPVTLDPIKFSKFNVTAIPNGQAIPELRDIAINLATTFGTIAGGGASIADLDIKGTGLDLAKAQQQVGQFADLGNLQLSGTGTFGLASKGDLTKAGGTSHATFALDLRNLIVKGLQNRQDLNEPRFVANAGATLVRGKEGGDFVERVQNVTVTSQAGEEQSPVLELAATVQSLGLSPLNAQGAQLAKLSIPDLARAQQQFGGFVPALKDFQFQKGSLSTNLAANYDGTTVTFTKPVAVALQNLTLAKVENGQPRVVLNNETLGVGLAGKASMPKDQPITADLSDLSVTSSSNLINIKKAGDKNINVALAPSGAIRGNGVLQITSDLKRLNDLSQSFSARPVSAAGRGAGDLTSGSLNTTLTLDHPENQKATNITLAGTIDNLSVTTNTQPIQNEKVAINLSAVSPDDLSAVTVNKSTINSSFANTTINDTELKLNATNVFDKLSKANIDIAAPDLSRLYAVLQAFSPPEAQPTADAAQPAAAGDAKKRKHASAQTAADTRSATTQPLAPLQVTSGGAHINLVVARDPKTQTTTITAPAFAVTKLGLARGAQKFNFDPNRAINLNFAAAVTTNPDTNPATTKPITEQIKQVQITQLGGDLAVAKLEMPQPVTITGLSSNPNANGTIRLTGALQQVTPLLAVMQGQPPKTYSGDYTLTQAITSSNNNIQLKGQIAVPNLQTDPQSKPQNFSVNNDLLADTQHKNATINDLTVAMPDTKALAVNLKGAVQDWETKRQFQNLAMNLSYDLAQLWPIIKPMLSPEQQEQYKDLKIAGQFQRTFNVGGNYPANVPFNHAIQSVALDGGLAIGMLDTQGIAISDLELPVSLQGGKLTTLYANKPKGERAAKPAKFNEGTLDLSSILVDLTQDTMRVSIGKNQPLVRNASINELLSDNLGKYINPVFANSKRAKGLLNVTVNECQNIALGDAMKSPQSGRATITFSLSDMDIANPVGALMLGPIINGAAQAFGGGGASGQAETFEGYIKDAVVTLDAGVTTQDITMQLVDPNTPRDAAGKRAQAVEMPMSFKGKITMADLAQHLDVRIPPELVAKFIPDRDAKKAFSDAFPAGIPIIMRGTTKAPKVDTGNILAKIAEAQAKTQLQKVLGGGKDNKATDTKGGGKSDNPLGGLLDQLKGGNKDGNKPAEQPATPQKKKKKPAGQ
ncbi:MAG TPA: hypothetical protein VF669_22105 [Tepidisphaeraceae bacterium]|jgi:hypothetical protein